MIKISVDERYPKQYDLNLCIGEKLPSIFLIDTYYLFDFLEIKDVLSDDIYRNLHYGAMQLITYWLKELNIGSKKSYSFLPFDLQDENVGGLLVLIEDDIAKISYVSTNSIAGWGVNKSCINEVLRENEFQFEKNKNDWQFSVEELLKSLKENIEQLKVCD